MWTNLCCPPHSYLANHSCIPVSPSLLCLTFLTYLLAPILTPSLSLSLPPCLSSYLPAAAQGLLALTVHCQTKEWIGLQKKKEGKRKTAMESFVLSAILSPILPCCCHSLSQPLSLNLSFSLRLFSVLSLRESSWSLISQSCLTVAHTVSSAQLQQQWPTS